VFRQKIRHRLSRLEAHHRLLISLGFAAVVFLVSEGHLLWRTRLIATWDAYALCVLSLAWARIVTAQPRVVVRLTTLLSRSIRDWEAPTATAVARDIVCAITKGRWLITTLL